MQPPWRDTGQILLIITASFHALLTPCLALRDPFHAKRDFAYEAISSYDDLKGRDYPISNLFGRSEFDYTGFRPKRLHQPWGTQQGAHGGSPWSWSQRPKTARPKQIEPTYHLPKKDYLLSPVQLKSGVIGWQDPRLNDESKIFSARPKREGITQPPTTAPTTLPSWHGRQIPKEMQEFLEEFLRNPRVLAKQVASSTENTWAGLKKKSSPAVSAAADPPNGRVRRGWGELLGFVRNEGAKSKSTVSPRVNHDSAEAINHKDEQQSKLSEDSTAVAGVGSVSSKLEKLMQLDRSRWKQLESLESQRQPNGGWTSNAAEAGWAAAAGAYPGATRLYGQRQDDKGTKTDPPPKTDDLALNPKHIPTNIWNSQARGQEPVMTTEKSHIQPFTNKQDLPWLEMIRKLAATEDRKLPVTESTERHPTEAPTTTIHTEPPVTTRKTQVVTAKLVLRIRQPKKGQGTQKRVNKDLPEIGTTIEAAAFTEQYAKTLPTRKPIILTAPDEDVSDEEKIKKFLRANGLRQDHMDAIRSWVTIPKLYGRGAEMTTASVFDRQTTSRISRSGSETSAPAPAIITKKLRGGPSILSPARHRWKDAALLEKSAPIQGSRLRDKSHEASENHPKGGTPRPQRSEQSMEETRAEILGRMRLPLRKKKEKTGSQMNPHVVLSSGEANEGKKDIEDQTNHHIMHSSAEAEGNKSTGDHPTLPSLSTRDIREDIPALHSRESPQTEERYSSYLQDDSFSSSPKKSGDSTSPMSLDSSRSRFTKQPLWKQLAEYFEAVGEKAFNHLKTSSKIIRPPEAMHEDVTLHSTPTETTNVGRRKSAAVVIAGRKVGSDSAENPDRRSEILQTLHKRTEVTLAGAYGGRSDTHQQPAYDYSPASAMTTTTVRVITLPLMQRKNRQYTGHLPNPNPTPDSYVLRVTQIPPGIQVPPNVVWSTSAPVVPHATVSASYKAATRHEDERQWRQNDRASSDGWLEHIEGKGPTSLPPIPTLIATKAAIFPNMQTIPVTPSPRYFYEHYQRPSRHQPHPVPIPVHNSMNKPPQAEGIVTIRTNADSLRRRIKERRIESLSAPTTVKPSPSVIQQAGWFQRPTSRPIHITVPVDTVQRPAAPATLPIFYYYHQPSADNRGAPVNHAHNPEELHVPQQQPTIGSSDNLTAPTTHIYIPRFRPIRPVAVSDAHKRLRGDQVNSLAVAQDTFINTSRTPLSSHYLPAPGVATSQAKANEVVPQTTSQLQTERQENPTGQQNAEPPLVIDPNNAAMIQNLLQSMQYPSGAMLQGSHEYSSDPIQPAISSPGSNLQQTAYEIIPQQELRTLQKDIQPPIPLTTASSWIQQLPDMNMYTAKEGRAAERIPVTVHVHEDTKTPSTMPHSGSTEHPVYPLHDDGDRLQPTLSNQQVRDLLAALLCPNGGPMKLDNVSLLMPHLNATQSSPANITVAAAATEPPPETTTKASETTSELLTTTITTTPSTTTSTSTTAATTTTTTTETTTTTTTTTQAPPVTEPPTEEKVVQEVTEAPKKLASSEEIGEDVDLYYDEDYRVSNSDEGESTKTRKSKHKSKKHLRRKKKKRRKGKKDSELMRMLTRDTEEQEMKKDEEQVQGEVTEAPKEDTCPPCLCTEKKTTETTPATTEVTSQKSLGYVVSPPSDAQAGGKKRVKSVPQIQPPPKFPSFVMPWHQQKNGPNPGDSQGWKARPPRSSNSQNYPGMKLSQQPKPQHQPYVAFPLSNFAGKVAVPSRLFPPSSQTNRIHKRDTQKAAGNKTAYYSSGYQLPAVGGNRWYQTPSSGKICVGSTFFCFDKADLPQYTGYGIQNPVWPQSNNHVADEKPLRRVRRVRSAPAPRLFPTVCYWPLC